MFSTSIAMFMYLIACGNNSYLKHIFYTFQKIPILGILLYRDDISDFSFVDFRTICERIFIFGDFFKNNLIRTILIFLIFEWVFWNGAQKFWRQIRDFSRDFPVFRIIILDFCRNRRDDVFASIVTKLHFLYFIRIFCLRLQNFYVRILKIFIVRDKICAVILLSFCTR